MVVNEYIFPLGTAICVGPAAMDKLMKNID